MLALYYSQLPYTQPICAMVSQVCMPPGSTPFRIPSNLRWWRHCPHQKQAATYAFCTIVLHHRLHHRFAPSFAPSFASSFYSNARHNALPIMVIPPASQILAILPCRGAVSEYDETPRRLSDPLLQPCQVEYSNESISSRTRSAKTSALS